MKRVAVIGGGISGLVCASRLLELKEKHRLDFEVNLFEKTDRLGGVLHSEPREGFLIEHGADAFITEKPSVVALGRRLGLESEVVRTKNEHRRTFVARNGRLIPLPEGFHLIAPTQTRSFLQSPLFSFAGKLRILLERWIPPRISAEDESVGEFIRRRFGREALERVGQPMLAGIYTGDPEALSLTATMPRFKELERRYGSIVRGLLAEAENLSQVRGPRYSLFCSFRQGMQFLAEAIRKKIPAGSLKMETGIRELFYEARMNHWRIVTERSEIFFADAVCSAVSAKVTAGFFGNDPLSRTLVSLLNSVAYESVASLNFAYKREAVSHALDGFGFVVPKTERLSLIACSFSSQKFEGRAPEGHVLLRAFVGGAFGREFFERKDAELAKIVQNDLSGLLGIRGEPIFSTVSRSRDSMVQYRLNHLDLVSEIETALDQHPGLYLCGSSYRGVGIADCVREAEFQAEEIFENLKKKVNP
jgi:oxygen-dependent protoporphyrinogen oxidase